jgi:hypothetical protein
MTGHLLLGVKAEASKKAKATDDKKKRRMPIKFGQIRQI